MKVLVTGSSGHVGSAIARHLVATGHEVVGLSRHASELLPESVVQIRGDLADPDILNTIYEHTGLCDAIVHAAASLDKRLLLPAVTIVNGAGTQQMLHLAAQWDVRAFVYLSGVAVIGKPQVAPIGEDHPCAPLTAYHASKLYGEHLTAIAARLGRNATTLRLSAPVGPDTPRGRIMRVFVERALAGDALLLNGKGGRVQNYVDVRDVAVSVTQCIERPASGTFNIGAGHSVSNRDLAERCIAALGSSSVVRFSGEPDPEEADDWSLSIERARKQFGYRPAHDLESSIAAIAEDCRSGR